MKKKKRNRSGAHAPSAAATERGAGLLTSMIALLGSTTAGCIECPSCGAARTSWRGRPQPTISIIGESWRCSSCSACGGPVDFGAFATFGRPYDALAAEERDAVVGVITAAREARESREASVAFECSKACSRRPPLQRINGSVVRRAAKDRGLRHA